MLYEKSKYNDIMASIKQKIPMDMKAKNFLSINATPWKNTYKRSFPQDLLLGN